MPEIFYDMDLDDFHLMQKGFFNKRKADDINFGKVAFYIAAIHQNGLAGKPIQMGKFISDWLGEKSQAMNKEDLKERSERIMKRVREMQKIEDEKIKLGLIKKRGKRTKNSN